MQLTFDFFQEVGNVSYLAASPDDRLIFLTTGTGGILCIDSASQQAVAEWKPENESINFTVSCMKVTAATGGPRGINFVTVVDKTGVV